jgi:DNA-binding FadR family transcriptional regulator
MMAADKKSPFRVVQSEKLSDQICTQILKTIISGHYKAGDLLPPERNLADSFGVSRVVVREALGSLLAKGIVSVRQGRGTTINPIDQWNTLDAEVLLLLHGDDIFENLIQMRQIIEPELAALAAEHITDEDIEELRELSDLPDDDTIEQHVERDSAFHLAIAKATGNPVLLIVLSSVSALLKESRRRTFVVPGEMPKARRCHQEIFSAIEARDPEAARQAMAAHMQQVHDGLKRFETL